jgi:putative peptidoglycan lipid II flippase
MRTPVKVALVSMAVNLVLTLGLAIPLKHLGNATGTTVAGWVNALLLLWLLHRRGHFTLDASARRHVPRIAAAALGMAGVLAVADHGLQPWLADPGIGVRVTALAILIATGLAAYLGLALLFGAGDWRKLLNLMRRRAAIPAP